MKKNIRFMSLLVAGIMIAGSSVALAESKTAAPLQEQLTSTTKKKVSKAEVDKTFEFKNNEVALAMTGDKNIAEFLVYADKKDGIYNKNIGIVVHEKNGTVSRLENIFDGGYDANISLIESKYNAKTKQYESYVLVTSPTGGSGGILQTQVLGYANGEWTKLLDKSGISVTSELKNNFNVVVNVSEMMIDYKLSKDEQKTFIKDGYYDQSGKVKKQYPDYVWADDFGAVVVQKAEDGKEWAIIGTQSVFAGAHINYIGTIKSTYKLNARGTALDLASVEVVDSVTNHD